MQTKLIKIEDPENMTSGDKNNIKMAGEVLKSGGLCDFPTETVYGLGGDALNPESSKKIYEAKGRPLDNPQGLCVERFADGTARKVYIRK